MRDVLKVIGVARLASDPELRSTPSGMSVCKLRIAWNTSKKDSSGNYADVGNFANLTVWGKQGEACARYLSSGRQIAFDARLEMNEWNDKETGKKRSTLELVADQVQFIGGGKDSDGSGGDGFSSRSDLPVDDGEFTAQPVAAPAGTDSSDIPF